MKKSIRAAVLFSALVAAGAVAAQGMLLDFAADKVIKKFTTASCEELKAQKTARVSSAARTAVGKGKDVYRFPEK